jgi:integrase
MQNYRDRLDRQVLPALGGVRVREISVGLIDRHLAAVRAMHGPALAKMTKSVISGMCALACRHDALRSNPCRDVARIPSKPRRAPQSLTVGEVKAVRTWLSEDAKARDRDLPDLVAFMVATGLRIGEACAVTWSDVDVDAGTVTVNGTVLRVKSQGLVVSQPKSAAGERVLELPSWCVDVLRRREASSGPLFPAPRSRKLRDPSNTRRALREAFLEMGMPGMTSHAFRKTVATPPGSSHLPGHGRPRGSAGQRRRAGVDLHSAVQLPTPPKNVHYVTSKNATGPREAGPDPPILIACVPFSVKAGSVTITRWFTELRDCDGPLVGWCPPWLGVGLARAVGSGMSAEGIGRVSDVEELTGQSADEDVAVVRRVQPR